MGCRSAETCDENVEAFMLMFFICVCLKTSQLAASSNRWKTRHVSRKLFPLDVVCLASYSIVGSSSLVASVRRVQIRKAVVKQPRLLGMSLETRLVPRAKKMRSVGITPSWERHHGVSLFPLVPYFASGVCPRLPLILFNELYSSVEVHSRAKLRGCFQ